MPKTRTTVMMPGKDSGVEKNITIPHHWMGSGKRLTRTDGAVVKWTEDQYYSNPLNPSARMWMAFEPDPGDLYLAKNRPDSRRRYRFRIPRKWANPLAAIQELDRLYPMAKV